MLDYKYGASKLCKHILRNYREYCLCQITRLIKAEVIILASLVCLLKRVH